MIVPQYWAEGRHQQRQGKRQITVRRFGWSDTSQAEAQANADRRAEEALQRLIAGEKLPRREPKMPYNGADGMPIREEILARQGDAILTRNAYGAKCLNTPNVLFADIDYHNEHKSTLILVALSGATFLLLLAGLLTSSRGAFLLALLALFALGYLVLKILDRFRLGLNRRAKARALCRVKAFAVTHPDWHLRLYRTPAGLRVLVMHQTFQPDDPAVAECFRALGTDPVYVRMCRNQQCFRARVSPKPWRIGVSQHLRPRPGVWPVAPERLHLRQEWVEKYEAAARDYASCAFVESLGSSAVHPDARRVQELHDELCRANSQLPLA